MIAATASGTGSGIVSGRRPSAAAIFAITSALAAWMSSGVSPATTRPWFCIRITVGSPR